MGWLLLTIHWTPGIFPSGDTMGPSPYPPWFLFPIPVLPMAHVLSLWTAMSCLGPCVNILTTDWTLYSSGPKVPFCVAVPGSFQQGIRLLLLTALKEIPISCTARIPHTAEVLPPAGRKF